MRMSTGYIINKMSHVTASIHFGSFLIMEKRNCVTNTISKIATFVLYFQPPPDNLYTIPTTFKITHIFEKCDIYIRSAIKHDTPN